MTWSFPEIQIKIYERSVIRELSLEIMVADMVDRHEILLCRAEINLGKSEFVHLPYGLPKL